MLSRVGDQDGQREPVRVRAVSPMRPNTRSKPVEGSGTAVTTSQTYITRAKTAIQRIDNVTPSLAALAGTQIKNLTAGDASAGEGET